MCQQALDEASTAFALAKTIQSKVPASAHAGVERPVVLGRRDADDRRLDRLGAERLEESDHLGGLLARTRDEHSLAEQRPRVEPAQMLAQRDDASHDENRRPSIADVRPSARVAERAERRLLGRSVPS